MGLFSKRPSKRKIAIEQIAIDNDLLFLDKDEYGTAQYFKDFGLIKVGGTKDVRNLTVSPGDPLDGQHGLFDYRYIIHTGKTMHVVNQTVFFQIDKDMTLPHFYLYPEKWYHKIGKWFGKQDINNDLHPEFSKNYIFQSQDPEFATTLFDDSRLTGFFNQHKGWHFEAVGFYLMMYKPTILIKPNVLPSVIATGLDLNEALKTRSSALRH